MIDIREGGRRWHPSSFAVSTRRWNSDSPRAKAHGRSTEAEVRAILTEAARWPHIGLALLAAAQDVGQVEDLPIPQRGDVAQAVNFE